MITKTHVDGFKGFEDLVDGITESIKQMDYEPVMIGALEVIADIERASFDAGQSPGGEKWAPNAPSTIKRKGHGIVLFETGALEKSLIEVGGPHNIHETSHRGLLFGTDLEYSIYNQEGTQRIPARPHVGVNEPFCDALAEEIGDFIVDQIKG